MSKATATLVYKKKTVSGISRKLAFGKRARRIVLLKHSDSVNPSN